MNQRIDTEAGNDYLREIAAAIVKPRFAPIAADAPLDAPRSEKRKRLWTLDAKFHCPVIGSCLDMRELRRLARRVGIEGAERLSDYALHSVAVNHAAQKTPFSEAIQKWLERKYRADIARAGAIDDPRTLTRYWREQFARGDVAGPFWALIMHSAVDDELGDLVYRDVHMLSHQAGAGQRANLRRLRELDDECGRLREKLAEQQRDHARRLEESQTALSQAEAERDEARRATSVAPVPEHDAAARIAALDDQLAQARHHAAELERRLAEAQVRSRLLEAEARASREDAAAAEQALRLLTDIAEDGGEMPDLAGRELLCVGGRINLREHYRGLVERCNGRFNYHDGGIEDGTLRLHCLLQRADAVICPADCVGHPAYYEVKRLCKRTGKPCVLLSGSGLGTFSRGLRALDPANGADGAPIISL